MLEIGYAPEVAKPRYPLRDLELLRAHAVERGRKQLGQALFQLEAARAAQERAAGVVRRLREEAATVQQAERQALVGGKRRVQDILVEQGWQQQLQLDERRALSRLERANTHLRQQEQQARARRTKLAQSQAESSVVARQKSEWLRHEKRRQELREEQQAEEIWLGQRYLRKTD